MMEAAVVFESAIEWLRDNYSSFWGFYTSTIRRIVGIRINAYRKARPGGWT